jgi:hypothetical protein
MNRTIEPRLRSALESPSPRAALARLMSDLLEAGLEREEIFTALQSLAADLHAAGLYEQEDLILEALDGFTGWCKFD